MRDMFTDIYRNSSFGGKDSRSGAGSDLIQTAEVRRRLPALLQQIGIQTMLDIPCGDFHWMKAVELDVRYTGADVVAEMIQRNQQQYGNESHRFVTLDLVRDELAKVDLVFCRDVLVHFSFEDVFAALRNIKRSGSEYLLTTTFTARDGNIDIRTGQWRPLNLERPPFGFPPPILIINEKCTEGDGSWGDKSLGLWKVRDLQATTPPVQLWAHPTSFGRVLLFSYAFPPMQVQMTPAVLKPMGAFSRYGYEVDVLCAAPFSPFLPRDESLLPYAEKHFGEVTRLSPPEGLLGKLRQRSKVLSPLPDLMAVMHGKAFDMLMSMNLDKYEAIVTWSPFHSINPVMVKLKRHRPKVRWLAQFSDPWVGNPLEWSTLTKGWNWWHEPNTVRTADFIVHSSRYSRDLMMHGHAAELINKTEVIPHAFDEELYPVRPKTKNRHTTLRHIGALYGRRSPEPLFLAHNDLLRRRTKLRGELIVELIGTVPPEMLQTPAAQSLPPGIIKAVPSVSYLESLDKMYDADILLLIEANATRSLFLPSKLSDYVGARTPIVAIVPPGGSEDTLKTLKCWHARPEDIDEIARAVEAAVDYVASGSQEPWCDKEFRWQFSNDLIAGRFVDILERMVQR